MDILGVQTMDTLSLTEMLACKRTYKDSTINNITIAWTSSKDS